MANKEHISALVDGELQDKVLLEQLGKDKALAATFGRYQLYGDAVRSELPTHLHLDLSDKIAAALEQEPTIVAPAGNVTATAVPQSATVSRPAFGRTLARHFAQFAVAASVSAAVIFGVQQYGQLQEVGPGSVLNTVPVSGSAAPVSLNYSPAQDERISQQDLIEQQQKINALLMDHELQQRLRQQ
ncbi:sigma-E factor negative regulatory protein [Zobellella maritima]|uniref:sigma-E factor negative regulatory protein n=1 Tax=Zobellella maritima TaxID=2059725 RepID=UPI000E3018B2|nr:RseA family anti-sigma factor [Zobellella maritima]